MMSAMVAGDRSSRRSTPTISAPSAGDNGLTANDMDSVFLFCGGNERVHDRDVVAWDGEGALHDGFYLLAGVGHDFEIPCLGVGKKTRVGNHLIESLTQRGHSVKRDARRKEDAPSNS